jgi:hypothetical protein
VVEELGLELNNEQAQFATSNNQQKDDRDVVEGSETDGRLEVADTKNTTGTGGRWRQTQTYWYGGCFCILPQLLVHL